MLLGNKRIRSSLSIDSATYLADKKLFSVSFPGQRKEELLSEMAMFQLIKDYSIVFNILQDETIPIVRIKKGKFDNALLVKFFDTQFSLTNNVDANLAYGDKCLVETIPHECKFDVKGPYFKVIWPGKTEKELIIRAENIFAFDMGFGIYIIVNRNATPIADHKVRTYII